MSNIIAEEEYINELESRGLIHSLSNGHSGISGLVYEVDFKIGNTWICAQGGRLWTDDVLRMIKVTNNEELKFELEELILLTI
jgi:hypothetical protein